MPLSAAEAEQINRAMPANNNTQLGTAVRDLQLGNTGDASAIATLQGQVTALAAVNTAQTNRINALLAKLDADAGVTDTNYAATIV